MGNTEFSGGDATPEQLAKIPNKVGCTSCVVLITQEEIFCANAGDSRCVLTTEQTSSYALSEDHKPENEDELIRMENAGGTVEDGGINGNLALSRSIGDLDYKQNR